MLQRLNSQLSTPDEAWIKARLRLARGKMPLLTFMLSGLSSLAEVK